MAEAKELGKNMKDLVLSLTAENEAKPAKK